MTTSSILTQHIDANHDVDVIAKAILASFRSRSRRIPMRKSESLSLALNGEKIEPSEISGLRGNPVHGFAAQIRNLKLSLTQPLWDR